MDFIKDLFYGHLQPSVRTFSEDSEYGKAVSAASQCEKMLTKALDDTLKSYLSSLSDAQQEILSTTAYESFLDGFLLGAGFVMDTFLTKHDRVFKPL